jgi:YD repeat-containing protein
MVQVGNITTVRNPLNDETGYLFDSLNRLTKITRPPPKSGDSNPTILYGYDNGGNLNKITDPESHVTDYTKDDFNNTRETISVDTGTTGNSFDSAGNLVSSTDSIGIITGYGYDALNRPISIDLPGSPSGITMSYDLGVNGKGHLTGIQDTAGSTGYSYTIHGQVSEESRTIDSTSYTTSYSYGNTTGSLSTMAYPGTGNLTLSMSRDDNGEISGLSVDGTPLLDTITRLPFGPVTTTSLTGSFSLVRSYDQVYNVSRIQAGTLDYQYTRDKKDFRTANCAEKKADSASAAGAASAAKLNFLNVKIPVSRPYCKCTLPSCIIRIIIMYFSYYDCVFLVKYHGTECTDGTVSN